MMFKMLVFVVAIQPIMLVAWLAVVYLSSGMVSEGLPFAAVTLMCCSYFFKGVSEAFRILRDKIKLNF